MPLLPVEDVSQKSFDYIVIGGGTAGLTLATRLSEDPSISVLVLEAGANNFDDPNIDMSGQFGRTVNDPKYGWAFKTVKQEHANNSEFFWPRGKGLGGTSAMNFYTWIKPPSADVDAVERLGNPGWNWEDYDKYCRKVENFHVPPADVLEGFPHNYDPTVHGTGGPIDIVIPHSVHAVDKLFQETLHKKGLKPLDTPYGGNLVGITTLASSLNPNGWTRSYSASAYLRPNLGRPNLNVLSNALVAKIVTSDLPLANGNFTATGIEFLYQGESYLVNVEKEVIVCAGTINSPQILELSGIGRPDVLKNIGADVKVDLPGVGENVQERVWISVSFELGQGVVHETLDLLRDREFAKEQLKLYAEGKGMFRYGITAFSFFPLSHANLEAAPHIYSQAENDVERMKEKHIPGLSEQLDIQLEHLKDQNIPDFEIAAFPGLFAKITQPQPGTSYLSICGVLSHPISRGTIHSGSRDPREPPIIDPKYFENQTDLEILVQHVKYIRTLQDIEPFKSSVLREVDPGPEISTDAQIRDYIKTNADSMYHTVGSCSMLPRSKQGVVDPKLKVYGTSNIRVADLSVFPLSIAAHTQATAYVIGEKAADIIKAEMKVSDA